MAGAAFDERKFTDQEVRRILKKAVEDSEPRALTKGEGLSLSELKAIAGEVGIDPARVEDAARLVLLGDSRPNPLLGAPTVLNVERKVDAEFDPADTPEALALIRRTMGQQGEANEIHGSLEWAVKSDIGERFVTLTSKEGVTSITGSANLANAAILTFLPAGIIGAIITFVGIVKSIQDGSMVGLIIGLAVLPILFPVVRAILRRVSDSESAKLQRVVSDLAQLTARSSGPELEPEAAPD